jgi:hypothetical protein
MAPNSITESFSPPSTLLIKSKIMAKFDGQKNVRVK